ncbi:hypothetical protein F2Q69_00020325 [Brassica cretica]|uniref:DUF1985 domain-containing protein n=1 Tax=Brassica cretica TaxID=69181 RepID=A0A8S9QFP7_BRACR|nr:hypothetical protein F2Q69_00020325 [Brassica cretica]
MVVFNCFAGKKIDIPELPPLHDDEYEELKESKLGVFIKFQEEGFDWASRLVHYMLGFQLDIKKKYELWSLVGPQPVRFSLLEFENLTGLNCEYIEDLESPHFVVTKELTSFWEMLGVHVEAGPSTQEIIAAFGRCEGWSRDDRKRLAYLAIFTGYIEGRKYSTPTRVSLARLVMELEREEAAAEASEEVTTTVGGLTKEDIKTMFKDIADAMREGFGTCLKEIKYLSERVEAVEKKVGITTKRKGTSSQNTTSPPKPTLEPGSESVNGTNAGRKSLAGDKGSDVPAAVPAHASSSKDKAPEPSLVLLEKNQTTVSDLQKEDARYHEKRDAPLALCRAKNDRTRKLAASHQSPYTANITARVIIPNKKLYPGYNPFAPIDKKKLKELADWFKICPHYRIPLDKKPRKSNA